jgi:urease gamma subunit
MNYYERPTPLQEQVNTEALQHFAEHLKQFKANCDALQNIECNLSMTASHASRAALQSSGHIIQTDDGTQWQHAVDLTGITSVCHRRTAAGLEFAIVECLSLKDMELRDVLNNGHDVREVLQAFVRDQRQVLRVWKDDVNAQVKEYLAEKYPQQDMNIVAESFEIKMARSFSQTYVNAQSQGRGVRI